MSLCFVFSGTSEGRELTEKLADSGIACSVFVATEYGNTVMKTHPNISVYVGRLTSEEIAERIKKYNPDYVVDATHPHAEVITENIKTACDMTGANDRYLRVDRNADSGSGKGNDYEEFKDIIYSVSSVDEAVNLLKERYSEICLDNRNIMLTTGVKELHHFTLNEIIDRLVVRVIPSVESLNEVYRCGINTKSVIAMEGPFSVEMNTALIKQYSAGILVTKNSGERGGFREKLLACKNCDIKAIVIEKKEAGMHGKTIDEAFIQIKSKLSEKTKKRVYLTGAGLCREEYLTERAISVIKKSEIIIGAKRMAEFGKKLNESAEIYTEYNAEKVLDIIDRSDAENIVVLYSGDTGLCSGAKGLERLICDREDLDVEVIPGISSVSYFASKLLIQYSDYPFISLHENHADYMAAVRNKGGFIAICSGVKDVVDVAKNVFRMESDKKIMCGFNLASEDEKIIKIDSETDLESLYEGLYVIAVID